MICFQDKCYFLPIKKPKPNKILLYKIIQSTKAKKKILEKCSTNIFRAQKSNKHPGHYSNQIITECKSQQIKLQYSCILCYPLQIQSQYFKRTIFSAMNVYSVIIHFVSLKEVNSLNPSGKGSFPQLVFLPEGFKTTTTQRVQACKN